MLNCMRTTINLPDGLAEAAKALAAAEGRTFTSVVEQGLRAVLDQPEEANRIEVPVFDPPTGGRGMLVNIADSQSLWDALDADRPR